MNADHPEERAFGDLPEARKAPYYLSNTQLQHTDDPGWCRSNTPGVGPVLSCQWYQPLPRHLQPVQVGDVGWTLPFMIRRGAGSKNTMVTGRQ